MLELQKDAGPTIVESVNKALEDRAVTAGQPTMAALKSPLHETLDEKVADVKRAQEQEVQRIATAHNLSLRDEDAGDSGFGDGGTDGNQ